MVAVHASVDPAANYLVRAAVTAPSVCNTQPWRFISLDGEVQLHADVSRRLAVTDPEGRELAISCGAALFNLRLAMRHLGFLPQVRLCPAPHRPWFLAAVRWGPYARIAPLEEAMFAALPHRHTHYGPFRPDPLPLPFIEELQKHARHEGADLWAMSGDYELRRLAEMIRTAETVRRCSPAFTAELANWTPPQGSARRDGLPAQTYPRNPDTVAFAGRDYAGRARMWHGNRNSTRSARPVLGVVVLLNTARDSCLDWLRTGQALQRVLLLATVRHVAAAFHTQPLELPDLREQLRQTVAPGRCPQMLLRLGYDNDVLLTPRRPVSDVLTREARVPARTMGEVGPIGPAPGPVRPCAEARAGVG